MVTKLCYLEDGCGRSVLEQLWQSLGNRVDLIHLLILGLIPEKKSVCIVVVTLLTRHHQMTLESDYKLLPWVLVRQYYLSSTRTDLSSISNGTDRLKDLLVIIFWLSATLKWTRAVLTEIPSGTNHERKTCLCFVFNICLGRSKYCTYQNSETKIWDRTQ